MSNKSETKAEDTVDTQGLKGDDKIIAIALDRFKQCQEATNSMRAECLEDMSFFGGKQWAEEIMRERVTDRRPALTINKIPAFANRVINDIRQNMPAIKIRPIDSVTDPDTANVVDGAIRHITLNGNSKAAISHAVFNQVVCGMGFFRVVTDYLDENSFDQEIEIKRIENTFSVYFPLHLIKEADYSDAPYAFIRTKISKDEFKLNYPDSKTQTFSPDAIGDQNWTQKDYIYLAEYFCVDSVKKTIYLLSDGSVVDNKKDIPEGAAVLKERDTIERKIKWYLMNEYEVLDRKDFPGKYIPIIPVLGQEISNIDDAGKKSYISLTRFQKDPQRMYNFWITSYTEKVANAPKMPYIVAAGQVENYPEWKDINKKSLAYARYSPVAVNGQAIPPPIRTEAAPMEAAIFQGVQIASQEMKEVSGIYDSSMGAQSNETSGKAIVARQRQGDISNFHFIDNLALSLHLLGRILVDLIPEIYDTPRAIRVLGEDMTDQVIQINQLHPGEDGKLYDLTVGKYDVMIDVGPSYETKRVEAATTLAQVLPQLPMVGQVAPDLIMRMLDNPLSGKVADRLKRAIQANPQMQGVIADNESGDSQELMEQKMRSMVADMQKLMQAHTMTMQQNSQMQQMIQGLQAALKNKSDAVAAKVHDTEVRAATELAKAKVDLQKEHVRQAPNMAKAVVDNAVQLHQVGNPEKQYNDIANPPAGNAENKSFIGASHG
jgi:hypothetical protein